MDNKGVDIDWDASPVSSPAMVLIHCGEVNKDKVTMLPTNSAVHKSTYNMRLY